MAIARREVINLITNDEVPQTWTEIFIDNKWQELTAERAEDKSLPGTGCKVEMNEVKKV